MARFVPNPNFDKVVEQATRAHIEKLQPQVDAEIRAATTRVHDRYDGSGDVDQVHADLRRELSASFQSMGFTEYTLDDDALRKVAAEIVEGTLAD